MKAVARPALAVARFAAAYARHRRLRPQRESRAPAPVLRDFSGSDRAGDALDAGARRQDRRRAREGRHRRTRIRSRDGGSGHAIGLLRYTRSKVSKRVLMLITMSAGMVLGASGKVVTLCDLSDHREVEGTEVSLRGRIGFTMHGAAFIGESCKNGPPGVALLFPATAHSPKVDFGLDSRALDQLGPFFRLTGGSAVACGVLKGKLFYKKHFHLHQYGAGPQGNGYGSRGALRWGFVIRSVEEIQACQ